MRWLAEQMPAGYCFRATSNVFLVQKGRRPGTARHASVGKPRENARPSHVRSALGATRKLIFELICFRFCPTAAVRETGRDQRSWLQTGSIPSGNRALLN